METTKTHNETLNESAKAIGQLFNSTNATMMEMYNKQLDMATSFYNNFFYSTFGNKNGWNQLGSFPNLFSNLDMRKWLSNPFTNFSATLFPNPFLMPMDKAMKQVIEFDQNLLSAFSGGFNGKDTNWNSLSEDFKETIAARLEASKKIFNIISEAYNKQMESNMETNNKMMEEINNLSNSIMKQNQKFWDDALKVYRVPFDGAEKKNKETNHQENKKHSAVHEVA